MRYFYLVHFQYLGYRYHGFQKQPGVKTIESMLEKTAGFILGDEPFKILGASRTDAMVSAQHSAFELFLDTPRDLKTLKSLFNQNLPQDIRVIDIEEVGPDFNIINTPKIKEYHYYFSFSEKWHPFCSPFMTQIENLLDIPMMQKGARLFEGEHNFVQYCTKPSPDTQLVRIIESCTIKVNDELSADFFPEKSYLFCITGKGFLRNQVRLMMGQLFRLGLGEITLDDIRHSLTGKKTSPLPTIAPPTGLVLHQIHFDSSLFS